MVTPPNRIKVVTYQATDGATISLTQPQIRKLERAGICPKTPRGDEYCHVSHGLHVGHPTYDDAQIAAMCEGR